MSKHISLKYDNVIKRIVEIDEVNEFIYLTIKKTEEGLEYEQIDVRLTKEECKLLGKLLLLKVGD